MTISRAQMASQLTGNKMKKIKKMNRGGSTGDSQMELARRADRKRRYSEDGPKGMSFSEAQTPIRYLASKILGRSERRDFERNQPRIRAEADDLERPTTASPHEEAAARFVETASVSTAKPRGQCGNANSQSIWRLQVG
jgi:hypothetical protein